MLDMSVINPWKAASAGVERRASRFDVTRRQHPDGPVAAAVLRRIAGMDLDDQVGALGVEPVVEPAHVRDGERHSDRLPASSRNPVAQRLTR